MRDVDPQQLRELQAWRDAVLVEGANVGRILAYEERVLELDRRRVAYREGIAEGDPACNAPAPHGMGVRCQREAGHPLGDYDRHKAVFADPSLAVSWNEPE